MKKWGGGLPTGVARDHRASHRAALRGVPDMKKWGGVPLRVTVWDEMVGCVRTFRVTLIDMKKWGCVRRYLGAGVLGGVRLAAARRQYHSWDETVGCLTFVLG